MFDSSMYNLMVKLSWMQHYRFLRRLWNETWSRLSRMSNAGVETVIHGYKVDVNSGYPYPLIARHYRQFNNPLIELVNQQFIQSGSVTLVDVGAGVGDTILLLQANCPDMLASFCCVDGDPEFVGYARKNLARFSNGKVIQALLSDDDGYERNLVRTHSGTASAQGAELSRTCSLDALLATDFPVKIDVLKIDVDGFDGKVLAGSRQMLNKYKPAVIFEWHPILCRDTGNGWLQPFDVLVECGYIKFVWFTKVGEFSHFMSIYDPSAIDDLAKFCLMTTHRYDWHYDVIALHESSPVDAVALSIMDYAMQRISRY